MENKQTPLCQNYSEKPSACNMKPMEFITNLGTIPHQDMDGNVWATTESLYQCRDCKAIKTN